MVEAACVHPHLAWMSTNLRICRRCVSLTPVQVLHDAFFKYQTKPKLSAYGDVYYEGRSSVDTVRTDAHPSIRACWMPRTLF